MTKQINNEPAYPFREEGNFSFIDNHFGLTKREAFAMAAMQGDIQERGMMINDLAIKESVVTAIKYADALLEALNNDT